MKYESARKRTSILRPVMLMTWLVAVLSVAVFAGFMVYHQRNTVRREMEAEARTLAAAIDKAVAANIVGTTSGRRLSAVVNECLRFVDGDRNLKYLVITLRDGLSLVHMFDGTWQELQLSGPVWAPARGEEEKAAIIPSPFHMEGECLHFSHLGIAPQDAKDPASWGWIHLGLSLDKYKQSLTGINRNAGFAGGVVLFIGALAAYVLARNITQPLRALQAYAQRVAGGALNARVSIRGSGEIGDLADSFNRMVESLEQSQVKIRESVKSTASLREKEILLREIHHRVKNNMQILTSLLRLQTRQTDSQPLREVLQESEARIRSMGLLHEKLYQSESVSVIDMHGYLRTLTSEIIRTNTPTGARREVRLDIQNVHLGLDTALPIGLIVTELVTNALKYAFPSMPEGVINVSLAPAGGGSHTMVVWDNGKGMDNTFDIEKATSLGMRLVKMLTAQLNGTLSFDGTRGTRVEILFRESEYKVRL